MTTASAYLTLEQADDIAQAMHRSLLRERFRQAVRTASHSALAFAIVYLIVSGPAQLTRLRYIWEQWLGLGPSSDEFSPSQYLGFAPDESPRERVDIPFVAEGHLLIPSLNVDAPILWNVPVADALNGLQRGVVQVQESYLPGENGRTFIAGHSAGYWWMRNPWTTVFSLLDQVKDHEFVFLKHNGTVYAYKVSKREVVSPDDVHVIRDDTLDHNQLALMTCTPVGTTLNRLIVYAEPVAVEDTSPNESTVRP